MGNARLSERASFMAEVDILALGTTSPRRVWGTDVSEGGMFLQTTHPFRVGDKVSVRFGVHMGEDEDHEVHVRAAEVRWVRPFTPVSVDGSLPGVGLKFTSIDPPARAALRRFTRPDEREEITMPERPPLAFTSLPPPMGSLPPLTDSIARSATQTPLEITEEMFAVSLPPFSTPPRTPSVAPVAGSLPPDEPMDDAFAARALARLRSRPPMAVPRDVTIGPQTAPPAASAHTFALKGWRFQRVVLQERNADAPPTTEEAGPAQAAATAVAPSQTPAEQQAHPPTQKHHSDAPAAADTMPAPDSSVPRENGHQGSATLGMAFDDERPQERSMLPSIIVEPSILSFESAPPDADSGPSPALEQAFLRGEVALTDLPRLEERAPARAGDKRPPRRSAQGGLRRALPVAAALIVVGTGVGAGIGAMGKRVMENAPPLPAAVALVPPALREDAPIRSVAELERELPALAAPAELTPPAPTPPTVVASAPPPPSHPAATAPSQERARAAAPVSKPATRAAGPGVSQPAPFRLDIPVGNAKVEKTFTLAGPPRVVVDMSGGTVPAQSMDGDGKKTRRVRFGTPRPGTTRVVVELVEGAAATHVAAKVSEGRLALSFR